MTFVILFTSLFQRSGKSEEADGGTESESQRDRP